MQHFIIFRRILAGLLLLACAACAEPARLNGVGAAPATRPNVLLIVADDLGYSDIAPFGGDIHTPNLARLAENGVRLTRMRAAPSCSPSRAMMLTGADSHVAGLGAMAEYIPPHYRGQQGFEGVLSNRVATLAERFADAGYRTAMAGKWHLGMADGERPAQRGFATSFALLQGAASHYGDGGFGEAGDGLGGATYRENDRPWEPQPGFYSSDVIAQKLVSQIANDGNGGDAAPFFAYLSFTAPHSPLQAPPEDIQLYADRYAEGWGALARERIAGMQAAGVLTSDIPDAEAAVAALDQQWQALSPSEQSVEARRMAVYAAMVDRMDRNIGDVLDALERSGQLENTIILFLSDNGPAGEDPRQYGVMPGFSERYNEADQSLEAMGSRSSFVLQDPRWASAIAAPSRLFKGFVTDGGLRVPAILCGPGLEGGTVSTIAGDMRDIAPTLLALAGIAQAEIVNGRHVAGIEGGNLLPWLATGNADRPAAQVAFGFNGQGVVRQGDWKAIRLLAPFGDGSWHLYDTMRDPAEMTDLQAAEPEIFASMMATWNSYVESHRLDERADLGVTEEASGSDLGESTS